jgi:hypothetical protein
MSNKGNGTFTNPIFYNPDLIRVGVEYYVKGITMPRRKGPTRVNRIF